MFPPKYFSKYTRKVNFPEAKVPIKRSTLSAERSFQRKTNAGYNRTGEDTEGRAGKLHVEVTQAWHMEWHYWACVHVGAGVSL